MKKIFTILFVFLGLLFIADRAIAHLFTKFIFLKTHSGERGGTVNFIVDKKNIDFLVMGSSRAKHQVDPALLTSIPGTGFNAGVNGTGGIVYNYLLLKLLIDKGVVPKTVLLQTDAFPYFTEDDSQINIELSPMYPFMSESVALKRELNKFTDYAEKTKLLFHTYRFNGKPLNIFYNYLKRNSIAETNGFAGLEGILDTVHYQTNNRANLAHSYSRKKLETLSAIINTCRDHHIRLIVLLPPSFKNSILSTEGTAIVNKQLQAQPGVSVTLDFSDINYLPQLQSAVYWRDGSHLNAQGAAIFSKLINDSLRVNATK